MILAGSLSAGTAAINIDPAQSGPAINSRMHGIFLEKINYGVNCESKAELT